MPSKIILIVLCVLALSWTTDNSQAGALRYAGDKIKQGAAPIARLAATGGQAAVGGMAAAGAATGSATKSGAVGIAKGAKASPGIVARGAKGAARGIWKAVW